MKLRIALCMVLALAASGVMPAALAADAGSGATFVSGGVGEDSLERMKAASASYNLKLLFAQKDGHFIADVAVTVKDAGGGKVLDAVAEGPWFLAKLAPGNYEVTASYEGKSFTRATTIPASGQREIVFRWENPPE